MDISNLLLRKKRLSHQRADVWILILWEKGIISIFLYYYHHHRYH